MGLLRQTSNIVQIGFGPLVHQYPSVRKRASWHENRENLRVLVFARPSGGRSRKFCIHHLSELIRRANSGRGRHRLLPARCGHLFQVPRGLALAEHLAGQACFASPIRVLQLPPLNRIACYLSLENAAREFVIQKTSILENLDDCVPFFA